MYTIPAHNLHLYEKPAVGTQFITRFTAYNWKHRIVANGGFDAASCDILPIGTALPQRFIDQFLGNWVTMIVDNPAVPEFEGFINRISFDVGDSVWTYSLDEMSNRVDATNVTFGGAVNVRTTAVNSTASQSLYGIKHETVESGLNRTAGTTRPTNLASTILAQRAWPKAHVKPGASGKPFIHLDILGVYHTLKWQERVISTTSTATLNTIITNATNGILPNLANGATFFDNTDFTDIASNAVTGCYDEYRGKTMWDVLVELQQVGDGTNYWIVGVGPTDPNRLTRRLYYRVMNSTIEYHVYMNDLRPRDVYNKLVPPWRVRPDAGVQIADWLPGGAIIGDDPRETYIMTVAYDANTQKVTWTGDDDDTAEGAFQMRRSLKAFNRRFGAAQYRSFTV